jgi:glycerol-3-phosphate O-acyltransferase/dihydroxyacetone phosphate acyltransferase
MSFHEISYGKSVLVTKEKLEAFRKNPKEEVKKLTQELEELLLHMTVNAPDWDTMKIIHTARRIYMSDTSSTLGLADYVEVTRRFSEFYLKAQDDENVKKLREDIKTYQEKLEQLHLKDRDVRQPQKVARVTYKVFDRLFFLLFLLPLTLPGFVVNWPLICIGKLANYLTPYQESKATMKLLISLVTVPVVYGLYAWLFVTYYWGAQSLIAYCIAFSALLLFGVIHVRMLEEELTGLRSVVNSLQFLWVIAKNTRRQELQKLQTLRLDLEKRITQVVDTYASPSEKILEKQPDTVSMGLTRKLLPPLIRRDSFSSEYL